MIDRGRHAKDTCLKQIQTLLQGGNVSGLVTDQLFETAHRFGVLPAEIQGLRGYRPLKLVRAALSFRTLMRSPSAPASAVSW